MSNIEEHYASKDNLIPILQKINNRLEKLSATSLTKAQYDLLFGEISDTVTVPSQKGTVTYNTESQSPEWNNYDTDKMTISGTTSGINAGDYTATFTLREGFKWSDETKTAKEVTWTIGKATGNITLSKNNVELSDDNPSDTVTFSGNTGAVSVSSADTSLATASINGSVITIAKPSGTPLTDIVTSSKIINDTNPIIIYDENSLWKGDPIEWQIIGIDQDGQGTITLQTNKSLTHFSWDSKNTDGVAFRKNVGANRVDSLLHQWLNSDVTNWYSSQHSNQAPSDSTVYRYANYDMDSAVTKGFMTNLSNDFKSKLVTVTKNVTPYQNGDPSSFTGNLFCLSVREVDPSYTYEYYIEESGAFTYQRFQRNSNSRRIRNTISNDSVSYWLRSPYTVDPSTVWVVSGDNSGGDFTGRETYDCYSCVAPACVLPSNINLEEDANGKYKIIW